MTTVPFEDFGRYSDVLRARSGEAVKVRFVEPRDAEPLRAYVRGLSPESRFRRFFGPIRELPGDLLDHFIHVGDHDEFSVVATMTVDGLEVIVGEARYAFHPDNESVEFGLSISDNWQRHGIGTSILRNMECRAASFGATRIYGDALRSNASMIALARKAGYGFAASPGEARAVRFEKPIALTPHEIPCASWRLAAAARSGVAAGAH